MTRYTLHVPAALSDGTPVSDEILATIESEILTYSDRFTRSDSVGAWKSDDGTTYREFMYLYVIDVVSPSYVGPRVKSTAEMVCVALGQECVYLTSAAVETLLVTPTLA